MFLLFLSRDICYGVLFLVREYDTDSCAATTLPSVILSVAKDQPPALDRPYLDTDVPDATIDLYIGDPGLPT